MADTEYKIHPTSALVGLPAQASVVSPQPLLSQPWKSALAPPGALGAARRTLLSQHMGGSAEFFIVSEAPDGDGTPAYPEADLEYTANTTAVRLTPGNWMEARCLFIPSGMTEWFDGASSYEASGAGGSIKYSHDYTSADGVDTDTGNDDEMGLQASQLANGAEWSGMGGLWSTLQGKVLADISIDDYPLTATGMDDFGEWCEVDLSINHTGGARVVHATVTERRREHVILNSKTDSTTHGWPLGTVVPTQFPQTKMADGATYAEERFGTHQSLLAAERQNDRMGPAVLQWSAYAESTMGLTDTKPDPVTTTSTTYVGLHDSSLTAWDADEPGYAIPAAYAQQFATSEDGLVLPKAACVPVRLRVWANFAGAGAATGSFKIQGTSRSMLTLDIAQSTTLAAYEISGYLECQRDGGDSSYVNLIPFLKTDDGAETFQVYYWSLEFGAFGE